MRIANLKKAVWGLMAFASTLVCVMDCYPLIPAVYGVYCLSSGHTIIFYIGLIIGMGYFISIPSICKYLFIIAVIYFGERLFVRKSSKNGCLTTAVVAACATAVMNLSVTFLGKPYTDEIVLSVAESLVVFSMAFALCRACEYLRALEHNENPVIAGLLPDREEAFATAVSGLSGIISTANVMAVKCTADKIPDESEKIQLEVTGRLCACCEGCSVCWTSGASAGGWSPSGKSPHLPLHTPPAHRQNPPIARPHEFARPAHRGRRLLPAHPDAPLRRFQPTIAVGSTHAAIHRSNNRREARIRFPCAA